MSAGGLVSDREGAVTILRLDRPHVLNALDRPLLLALHAAIEAAADPGVRCIVLTGNGRAFCAGGDLTAFLSMSESEFAACIELLQDLARRMRALRVPTVAAVHGYVLAGGLELAAADAIRQIKDELVSGTDDAFEAALRAETHNELASFATPEVRARLQAFADRKRGRSASSTE